MKNKNINVLLITSGHSSFDDRIYYKEAKSLAKEYNVTILSRGKNFKVLTMDNEEKEEGLYEGVFQAVYANLPSSNIFLRIFRVLFRNTSLGRYFFYRFLFRKIKELNLNPKIIHLHDFDLLWVGKKLKKDFKAKIIFDCHEFYFLYPLNKYPLPIALFLLIINAVYFKKHLKHYDFIISVNKLMKAINLPFNPNCLHEVIYNASDFEITLNKTMNKNAKITLIQEGSLKFDRGLRLICNLFFDEWFRNNVIIKIVGCLKNKELRYFVDRCKEEPWLKENITFTGWIKYTEVKKYLTGDIGIILFDPIINSLFSTPIRFFNYIAAEIPVLSVDLPETTDIINEYQIGEIVERNNNSIKNGIQRIINNYGIYQKNVLKCKKVFSWKTEECKLLKIYKDILNNNHE